MTPPTIVSGVGAAAALAGATPPVKPSQTYRLLTAATEKDFTAWLKTGLIAPLTAGEVTDFLALDTSTALDQLKATPAWIATVQATLADVDAISPPTTTSELVAASRTLVKLLNDQQSVRSRLTAVAIPAAGKIISDAIRLLRTAPLTDALAIDSAGFLTFTRLARRSVSR